MNRNTAIRDRHRAHIKASRPPCAICGQAIDYELPFMDPQAFVVDHIIPLARGGTDELSNKQAAHRSCNGTKSSKLEVTSIVKTSGTLNVPRGKRRGEKPNDS